MESGGCIFRTSEGLRSRDEFHVRCSQCFQQNFMDIGSSLGTMLGIVLNYKRNLYVHCLGFASKANIDSSPCQDSSIKRFVCFVKVAI